MLVRIVLLVDKAPLQRRLQRLLTQRHVLVTVAQRKGDLWAQLARDNFDLLVISHSLLQEPLQSVVGTVRKLPDRPDIIVIWKQEDPQARATLLAAGCLAAVYQDLPDQALADTLTSLVNRKREEALRGLRAERFDDHSRISDFVSASPAMQKFMTVVRRVLSTDSSLLILGETGVGKERLARAIHAESPRAAGPFIAVNCAALSEGLLESELFGHEEGAFTGAIRSRRGFFELAHRGTIFLDEIGELPLHLQTKLLRVLQERRIQPVGSETLVEVDVRVMAATNRDLAGEALAARRFRADLYYRLGVVTLTLPPLRERHEDIPALVESYLQHFSLRLRRPVTAISSQAMQAMIDYPWPGNVRELINVMERAVLLCTGSEIAMADLPDNITNAGRGLAKATPASALVPTLDAESLDRPWRQAREQMVLSLERAYLDAMLARTAGRVGDTARRAGMTPRSLFAKMRRHGLRKEDYVRAARSAAGGQ